jgi:enoyl-CoA hydratase/carnithine racemase
LLSKQVLKELYTCLEELAKDPHVKVLILTAAGTFFIVGADVKEIAAIKTRAEGTEASSLGQMVINQLEQLPIPVIAAINGHCLGGGNELVMACTFRIAIERARFGQPEINLGIVPGFGGTQRLPRLVGVAKALELMLTGDMIGAKEAQAIGLIHRVVPEEELMKQALGLAKKIASKSKPAIARILRLVREGLRLPLEEGLKLESQLFGELCETYDMREGLTAFLEKRQPRFEDR